MPRVTTNGVETYYERQGEGPPIVFIHGLSWDHRSWLPQLTRLDEEYDLVAYDYRSHGNTDTPADHPLSIELLAEDLHALIDEVGLEQPVLCGHSYGGLIAAEYAIQYPENVAGLVFADARTDLGESTLERTLFRVQPVLSRIETIVGRDRVRRGLQAVLSRLLDMEQGSDEEVPELGMTPSEYAEDASSTFDGDAETAFLNAGREYVGARATDFHVPVLYVYGELTGETIAGKADRLERAPTDVRVREIADAGHALMLEQPDAFTTVLREFLEDVTGPRQPAAPVDE